MSPERRLVEAIEAEIARLDPDGHDLFRRAWLNRWGRGWVDGVKTSRAVVRERLTEALGAYREATR